jgi:flagellar basal-body rod protein FlgB
MKQTFIHISQSDETKRTLGKKLVSSFNNIFGIHENALYLREHRMRVLSENIANVETPHYKSRDIDFKAAMSASSSQQLNLQKTDSGHLGQRGGFGNYEVFRRPINASPDANTVELYHQQAEFGKESGRYMATVQFIENRVGGIRRALRGE